MEYRTLDSLINEAKSGVYVPEETKNGSLPEAGETMYRIKGQGTKQRGLYQKALQGYGYQTGEKVVFVEEDDE